VLFSEGNEGVEHLRCEQKRREYGPKAERRVAAIDLRPANAALRCMTSAPSKRSRSITKAFCQRNSRQARFFTGIRHIRGSIAVHEPVVIQRGQMPFPS